MMAARQRHRHRRQTVFARPGVLSVLVALLATALAPPPSAAAPLETVSDIGPALLRCWRPPAAPDGSAVTLRFSFRRDGSLMGVPLVTYVGVNGAPDLQRDFADSAVHAIQECSPLELAPRFAATIGGKVYVMQFAVKSKRPTVREMYA
jgi:hypothetical protein